METDARNTARRYYAASNRSLEADVAALMKNPTGALLFSPRLVVLMKPVQSRRPDHWANLAERPLSPDAWYVHLLAGDISLARELARALPPLQWLCFQRGLRSPRPHVLPWRRFILR